MTQTAYSSDILELLDGVRQAQDDLGLVNVSLGDVAEYLPPMTMETLFKLVDKAQALGLVKMTNSNRYIAITAKGWEVA